MFNQNDTLRIIVKNLHIATISLRMGVCHGIVCVPQRPNVAPPYSLGHFLLLTMKYVHPPDSFVFTDLAEIDLGCFQVLVSQDDL